MTKIEIPTVGEILKEEFMVPFNLSAYRLAKDIGVPISRIQDILHNRRKITAETSIRLGIYFGLSITYFLNLQTDYVVREASTELKDSIEKIRPFNSKI